MKNTTKDIEIIKDFLTKKSMILKIIKELFAKINMD